MCIALTTGNIDTFEPNTRSFFYFKLQVFINKIVYYYIFLGQFGDTNP